MKNIIGCFLLIMVQFASAFAQKPTNVLLILADDWSAPHAGFLGDKSVKTPNLDKLASEGVVFENAFCAVPSCTPSRASILTGRYPHQLGEGANLWGTLSAEYPNYSVLLEQKGYLVGYERKGWFPAEDFSRGGYTRNPAGYLFDNFNTFLANKKPEQGFCYWFGSNEPHRGYKPGSGRAAGINESEMQLPAWLPDDPRVREDVADYYGEIQKLDSDVGTLIAILKEKNLYDNTLIIITSDNGMPFPRAKANLYDSGIHMPLLLYWKGHLEGGRRNKSLISLTDLAPTILSAAGIAVPDEMIGLPLAGNARALKKREYVYAERERHGWVRRMGLAYPSRVIRHKNFSLVWNLRPERAPAGDSILVWSHGVYGDVDGSPTKDFMLDNRELKPVNAEGKTFYEMAFAKRPEFEFFDLRKDPSQLVNLAEEGKYKKQFSRMQKDLFDWMKETGDPLISSSYDVFETYPFYGNPDAAHPASRNFKLKMKIK